MIKDFRRCPEHLGNSSLGKYEISNCFLGLVPPVMLVSLGAGMRTQPQEPVTCQGECEAGICAPAAASSQWNARRWQEACHAGGHSAGLNTNTQTNPVHWPREVCFSMIKLYPWGISPRISQWSPNLQPKRQVLFLTRQPSMVMGATLSSFTSGCFGRTLAWS